MPIPSVDPIPRPPPAALSRLAVPEDAHDASYLAASARISSFCIREASAIRSLYVLARDLARGYKAPHATPQGSCRARPRRTVGFGAAAVRPGGARGRRRLARLDGKAR